MKQYFHLKANKIYGKDQVQKGTFSEKKKKKKNVLT